MTTIATLLSGGEGVGVGARDAGLRHIWGIEADDAIADVARANGFDLITAKIQDVDPTTLEVPDVLHASPECQRASQARQTDEGGRESPLDREIGASVCDYLLVMRPKIFTLENVWGYRNFTAFQGICATLNALGYFYHYANVNAADFGVPQTRRRLILRAVRGGLLPELPAPEPWVGWYEAIEDLIPGLPESKFAPWQLARLPDIMQPIMIGGGNTNMVDAENGRHYTPPDSPSTTIAADISLTRMRAFILSNAATQWGDGVRVEAEPVHAITSESNGRTRAFIIGGQFAQPDHGDGATRTAQRVDEAEPIFFVTAVNKGDWRAWLSQGRVVKMTPRCLARFQSFPDSYILPDSNALACRVIGNAVPPLLYEKIIKGLTGNA